ncbi:MAG: PhzF family phenazine biosynthesis protein [Gammaproteobacteria bacterium]|nr:PhzF family phenazine biosynthesis protein [Gammaproteobacteria bacterium]
MLTLPLYQVDAFANRPFTGNPAAVVPLTAWLEDGLMQAIAMENNLAETAFFVPTAEGYHLRWFTPLSEVRLCGHATLATAHVLFEHLTPAVDEVWFASLSGPLGVRRLAVGADGRRLLELDFPAQALEERPVPPALLEAIGAAPAYAAYVPADTNWFLVYASQAQIETLRPDFRALAEFPEQGVIVTAPGDQSDFASRYFAPAVGIDEDPVTGSIHCALTPYWAARLGKTVLHARQLSRRGGELACTLRGDRVGIAGHAVDYLVGQIRVGHA